MWVKKGLVYELGGRHVQLPVVDQHDDGTMTVYFSTRDADNRSRPMRFRTGQAEPGKAVEPDPEPVLELGEPGTFDEHGIMPSCVLSWPDVKLLYYIGWSRRVSVPYALAIGVAVSINGLNFVKLGKGPLLGCTMYEPYGCTTPYVSFHEGDWTMWYSSFTGWQDGEPLYRLRRATAPAPLGKWTPQGFLWRDYKDSLCSCRPVPHDGKLLYSYRYSTDYRNNRNRSYRVGCAERDGDGLLIPSGLYGPDVSESGWDSDMIAYGAPYTLEGKTYLLYNGNGFGKTGLGYCILEECG